MASIKTKFSVGVFVVFGLIGVATAVLWLGFSHLFEQSHSYVAYFDESVQGLSVDSPVKYRGVSIGRVANIAVAPDGLLIQVLMKIDENKQIQNLEAQIKSVGITGIMYVELERIRADVPDHSPALSFAPPFPVIPTRPSGIKKFVETMEDILDRFNALDIAGLLSSIEATAAGINKNLSDLELGKISEDVRKTLASANELLDSRQWRPMIASLRDSGKNIEEITVRTKETIDHLNNVIARTETRISEIHSETLGTMRRGDVFLEDGGRMIREIDITLANLSRRVTYILQNVEKTSESVNLLMDYASDQPSRFFFGDPPEERPLEKDLF